jgi:glycosyltransferase involved in cell wall biosynthesis
VGFVARLAPEKNPGMFFRMAALLASRLAARGALRDAATGRRSVEFVVVGDGEIRSELEGFAEWLFDSYSLGHELRHGSQQQQQQEQLPHPDPLVKFTGWVLRDSLPQLMSTIDIIVNPSLRDSETFCIANLEAMAAGAALVTFANGGQSEYMRNETYGLVVGPQPTADGLADAVEWLLEHPVRACVLRA